MKHLLLTLALSAYSANLFAEVESYSEIEKLFNACRQESNTPFVKSPSHSGYYYIGKRNGFYNIKIDIQLRYPAYFSDDELVQANQTFEEVKDWIKQYYMNYGLNLDIQFEHAHFNKASSNPHPLPQQQSFVVYIRRHTGSHMKELYWGVNQDWDINETAKVIAHEFSHLLGLENEYLTATGAQTAEEEASHEDDSLMKNVDHPDPKLYLRHFEQILSPLCPPTETLMAQESVSDLSFSR